MVREVLSSAASTISAGELDTTVPETLVPSRINTVACGLSPDAASLLAQEHSSRIPQTAVHKVLCIHHTSMYRKPSIQNTGKNLPTPSFKNSFRLFWFNSAADRNHPQRLPL